MIGCLYWNERKRFMGNIDMIEWVGYLGSVLVAVSLMMTNIIKLRIINMVGAICFAIYGFTIHAMPVAVINSIVVVINLYYLFRMFSGRTAS
jgi:hypothetical protein